jgi:hypothetical protein
MFFDIKNEIYDYYLKRGIYFDESVLKFILFIHVNNVYLGDALLNTADEW